MPKVGGVAFPLLPTPRTPLLVPLRVLLCPRLPSLTRLSRTPFPSSLGGVSPPSPLVPSALLPHPLPSALGLDRGGEAGPHPPLHVPPPTPSELAAAKEDSRDPPPRPREPKGPLSTYPPDPRPLLLRFSLSPSVSLSLGSITPLEIRIGKCVEEYETIPVFFFHAL